MGLHRDFENVVSKNKKLAATNIIYLYYYSNI